MIMLLPDLSVPSRS